VASGVSAMTNRVRSTFEQCALASGLLVQQQLDEARDTVRWSEGDEPDATSSTSDKQLADRLVEMKLLNAWQAKQLLDGRTKFNLGPYQIVDSLGQGGMGQVFKARHEKMDRTVAIKVLPRDKSTPEAVASFIREIRALASLDHMRLVRALDAGEDGGVHYLVTEYVPGNDLRKLVRHNGPLGMSAAASIIGQVAEALEYAHGRGIVHRDVKPGNVLVSPQGEAKLSDLGLAGPLTGEAEADPRYGKVVGTADYISPDQIRDPWNPTPAWDIYSLGCTLYYAVTGKVPYPGGTTADKTRAHCEMRPLDPRRLNSHLSSDFVEVMADMMAKDPAQRIASAEAVIDRLAPFLVKQTVPAHPTFASAGAATVDAGVHLAMAPLPPPIVSQHPHTPHPARTATAISRRFTPGTVLADTLPDSTDAPTTVSDDESSKSEVLETFEPLDESREDHSPSSEISTYEQGDLMTVLWPLTVYVLAPLALLGAIVLLTKLVWAVL
jgi:eukaryotic-like serine/threonine-protein kinase